MISINNICQIAILILGSLSVFLVGRKNKWGFFFALLAQPFWFGTAFINKQWGIFIVSIIYTINWGVGFRNWFFPKKTPEKAE